MEIGVDVSAGDVSAGDAAVPEYVVTVSGGDVAESATPGTSSVMSETVVDVSPLVGAIEAQTADIKKGFVAVVMLLGLIAGMIFMKGFWSSRG